MYWLEGKRQSLPIWESPPAHLCQVHLLAEEVREGRKVVHVRGVARPPDGPPCVHFAAVEVPLRARPRGVERA